MNQLLDRLTESLEIHKLPYRRDIENQSVVLPLPTKWNQGELFIFADDHVIYLLAFVGGTVPGGSQALVDEALRLANNYCKHGKFSLNIESQIVLSSSCLVRDKFPEKNLMMKIYAFARYWDKVGHGVLSIIRDNAEVADVITEAFKL